MPATDALWALVRLFGACLSRRAIRDSAADAADEKAALAADDPFRLPPTLRPEHYAVTLLSDVKRLRFQGVVVATLSVLQDTREIQLNIGDGLVAGRFLVHADGVHAMLEAELDRAHERAILRLPQTLAAGTTVEVTVPFTREIDDSLTGYYYSTWSDGEQKGNYALTQFAPTAARRAFPCWDEPALKARFTLRMIHRTNTTALGNMPAVAKFAVDEARIAELLRIAEFDFGLHVNLGRHMSPRKWTMTEFAESPQMSSYLYAYANGKFKHVSTRVKSPLTGERVPLRVYTTPEFRHQAEHVLKTKAQVLPEYERVFDIAYPLPKLDTLTVADFGAGAMENWGLIMGRTNSLLYDARSGLRSSIASATMESHEVAHMWFGNITTFYWWDNVWLNEAFATIMGEVIILDRVHPEWGSRQRFVVEHLTRALELDSKRSSHPIEMPLQGENVEDAINQVFDAISYSKGASVLRMLSRMLGEDVFLQGVSRYLKKHLYGNAVTRDLWNGISEASGKDVSQIMDNWVLKQGFPVLTVTEGENSIRVRQNRFLSTGDPSAEEDATVWHVPLALRKVGGQGTETDMGLVLSEREKEIPLENASGSVWKLNGDTIGVYRVAYSPEHLARLGEAAARPDGGISLEDRVGLVSDAFTLAQAGYSQTTSALSLVHRLRGDESYLVNQAAAQSLGKLASVWWEQPAAVRSAINKLRVDIFGPLARKVTFRFGDDDSIEQRELRISVLGAAAAAGDEWTLEQVRSLFAPLEKHGDDSQIHPDLVPVVLVNAVRYGGEREYEAVLRLYEHATTPTHRTASMTALAATQHGALVKRTLEMVADGRIKSQDYM